jgi:hypothetical protein
VKSARIYIPDRTHLLHRDLRPPYTPDGDLRPPYYSPDGDLRPPYTPDADGDLYEPLIPLTEIYNTLISLTETSYLYQLSCSPQASGRANYGFGICSSPSPNQAKLSLKEI